MLPTVEEIRELMEFYPPWVVLPAAVAVAAGLGYLLWRVVKFSFVMLITLLLLGLAAFAAWAILFAR